MNVVDSILASLPFGTLSSLVITVGLALIGLAFTVAVLSRARAMAAGEDSFQSDDDDDEGYR